LSASPAATRAQWSNDSSDEEPEVDLTKFKLISDFEVALAEYRRIIDREKAQHKTALQPAWQDNASQSGQKAAPAKGGTSNW
jgi:hypothetical protein